MHWDYFHWRESVFNSVCYNPIICDIGSRSIYKYVQGVAEKSGPLKFFAVFSATVWNFNLKFYRFIY